MGNHNLFMGGCHSGVNQQFWWNTGAKLEILKGVGYWRHRRFYRSTRKYLRWHPHGSYTFLSPKLWANQQETLKFVKVGKDWYNIMATNSIWKYGYYNGGHFSWRNGFSLDNSYLSVNSQGTRVNFWTADDGSGRQRWKIKGPIAGGGYNIIVAGGVKGNRKYLSTNSAGTRVDLWIKDDGSGRQRWKMTGELVPTPKPTPGLHMS